MTDATYLDWPFFDDQHRALACGIGDWAKASLADDEHDAADLDAHARSLLKRLGEAGWLKLCVPRAYGGSRDTVDIRSVSLARDTLARTGGLADFVFALQGLGSLPITLAGTPAQRSAFLPPIATGACVPAFALSEPDAGSDAAALTTAARLDGDAWILNGTKTWISNAGLADYYVVFARTGAAGSRGLSGFIVDARTPGFTVTERTRLLAPHPIGTLQFTECRVPADRILGAPGDGFKIAMSTLDLFRTTVGAAALGYARRALDESLNRALARVQFGKPIAEHQLVQEKLAQIALDVDASALLVYRAAWAADTRPGRVTREVSMAKLYATEAAQRAADAAVQLHGGLGVLAGAPVERLYRAVRALRIYEGTTEIQHLVIAQAALAAARSA